jgi:hypothetical protein
MFRYRYATGNCSFLYYWKQLYAVKYSDVIFLVPGLFFLVAVETSTSRRLIHISGEQQKHERRAPKLIRIHVGNSTRKLHINTKSLLEEVCLLYMSNL